MSPGSTERLLVGVVSDTHGTLDPRIAEAFSAVDHIIHAGDIGSVDVLLELETLAPVTAVLGNTDREIPGHHLPLSARLTLVGVSIHVTHDARARMSGTVPEGTDVAICGHTHVPEVRRSHGVLRVNPGAPHRSRAPGGVRTVALLELSLGQADARIVRL